MSWTPIETAPKDGTEILGSSPYGEHSIAAWIVGFGWVGMCEGQRSIEYQSDFGTEYHTPFLTHWMPLPEPPKGGDDE